MQLVIAEKPSVARDLARVLGVRASGRECFEGERCVITWCIGHLVELEEPAAYEAAWKSWRIENLPMLPREFRLRAAKHARQQLRVVSDLLRDRRFRAVVNACDAGREGELIFRYVYQYARATLPIQRLWVSSLTDDAIRRGFASLRPGAQLEPLADAARSRSEADWLVGMNATRAITARGRQAGHETLYSIGRVQTPTLAMLVAREREIRNFVPRPYWEVRGEFRTHDGARFTALWKLGGDSRLATRELADAIVTRDRAATTARPNTDDVGPRVERTRSRTTREPPPLLFDLTSLQRTANRRFGFSAQRTLEIAQALYERHKVLTYPRTDSRHLSSDLATEMPALFASLAAIPDYAAFANALLASPPPSRGKRIFDDAKVTDHHAIIPTATSRVPSLDRDEQRIYDLVVRRFLGAFYPDAEFAITEAWIRVGPGDSPTPPFPDETRASPPARAVAPGDGSRTPTAEREPAILDTLPPPPDRYFARGRVRLVAGWQEVAGINADSDRAPDGQRGNAPTGADGRSSDDTPTLPPLVVGQPLDGNYAHTAKQTTPPPRYTEATLLGAMETAGRSIDDEALRAAMKDRGLGTPATRASIIETLVRRAYLVRERQHLVPTVLGITLIDSLPVASLASPELTGTWEARLARIARGEDSRASFMADIARYVAETVDAIRIAPPPAAPPPGSAPPPQQFAGGKGRRGGRRRTGARSPADQRASPTSNDRRSARTPRDPNLPRSTRKPRGKRRGSHPDTTSSARRRTAPREERHVSDSGSKLSRPPRRDESLTLRGSTPSPRDGWQRAPIGHEADPRFGPSTHQSDPRLRPSTHQSDQRLEPVTPLEPQQAEERMWRELRRVLEGEPSSHEPAVSPSRTDEPPRSNVRLATEPSTRADSVTSTPRASRSGTPATTTPAPPAASRLDARTTRPPRMTAKSATPDATDLQCPACRQATLIAGARGWGCARWREGCRFVIWFETAGRRVTPAQLAALITKGKTRKATFEPIRGKPQEGRLVLDASANDGAARFEPL